MYKVIFYLFWNVLQNDKKGKTLPATGREGP
jgi:hypothetical protein